MADLLNWVPYCACRHAATVHHADTCSGFDSYAGPCACPSFALSRECEEGAVDSGELPRVEAWLAGRGLGLHARP